MSISYTPCYQPSLDAEPGVSFDARQFKPRKDKEKTILREAGSPFLDEPFDDTGKVGLIDRDRKILSRLREHGGSFAGQDAHKTPDKPSPAHFQRGIPTNDSTSARNYKPDHVRIIKGEHVSLMKNGALNEAMDSDDHDAHILEHRYMLSDPKLTETMRSALLEHIAAHAKLKKKGMKQMSEDLKQKAQRKFGPAVAERTALRHNADVDDKMPQDSPFDAERKRTSGMVSMEAGVSRSRAGRSGRYASAMKIRRGL